MKEGLKYTKNLLSNILGNIALVLIVMVGTPILINTMGSDAYALWRIMVFTIISYAVLFDLGITASVKRYLGNALACEDYEKAAKVGTTAFYIYALLGALGALVVLSSIFWLPLTMEIPDEFELDFSLLAISTAIYVFVLFINNVYGVVFFILGRFEISQALLVFGRAGIFFGAPLLIISCGMKPLAAMSATICAVSVLLVLFTTIFSKKVCPKYGVKLAPPDLSIAESMFSFGIYGFFILLGPLLANQTQPIIIGQMLSLSAVTSFSVLYILYSQCNSIVSSVTSPFFTIIMSLYGAGKFDELGKKFSEAISISFLIEISCVVPICFMAGTFFKYWISPEYYSLNKYMLMFLPAIIGMPYVYLSTQFLTAVGNIKPIGMYSIYMGISSIILTYALLYFTDWGLGGVVIAFCIPYALRALACLRSTASQMKISWTICLKPILNSIPVFLIGYVSMELLFFIKEPDSLFLTLFYMCILATISILTGFFVFLGNKQRNDILACVYKALPYGFAERRK
ncbi:MAG: MATE family efflux transporter [Opitutales bacterium]|nr:MATE family efflux transporter [Opitutales bacterium]